jgi:hypothetical protein
LHPRVTLIGGHLDGRQTPAARTTISCLLAAAQALKPSGAVLLIGDPEGLGKDPVDCLLARHASMASCTTTWPAASLEAYDEVARGAKQLGVGFLPTRGFVCYERRCPAVIGHTIAWMDNNHMTVAYSVEIAGAFRAAFLRAIPKRLR